MRVTRITGMVPANGAQVYFECTGTGPSLALIPDPNTSTDLRIWSDQVATFAKHYRVVRYDLRGLGRSPRRLGVYRHAQDLAGLLDSLDIKRVALVSLRRSADIALDLALDRPELVAALVLVEPLLSGWYPRAQAAEFDAQVLRLMESAAEPNPAKRLMRMGATGKVIGRTFASQTQSRRSWRRMWASAREWAIMLPNLARSLATEFGHSAYTDWRHLHTVDPMDLNPEAASYRARHRQPPVFACLEQVLAPTLIVRGVPASSLVMEHDEDLCTRIARTEIVLLKDASRLPHMIQPQAFNRIVLDFLRRAYSS